MLHTTLFFRKALYIYLSKTSAAIWVIMMRHCVIEAATVPLLRIFCTTHFGGDFFRILLSQQTIDLEQTSNIFYYRVAVLRWAFEDCG